MKYVIDRIEENYAVCDVYENDRINDMQNEKKELSETKNILLSQFPFEINEGMIFNYEYIDGNTVFSIDKSTEEAELEQKKIIRSKLDRLFKKK